MRRYIDIALVVALAIVAIVVTILFIRADTTANNKADLLRRNNQLSTEVFNRAKEPGGVTFMDTNGIRWHLEEVK